MPECVRIRTVFCEYSLIRSVSRFSASFWLDMFERHVKDVYNNEILVYEWLQLDGMVKKMIARRRLTRIRSVSHCRSIFMFAIMYSVYYTLSKPAQQPATHRNARAAEVALLAGLSANAGCPATPKLPDQSAAVAIVTSRSFA